jgi:hypothetical protein
VLIELVALMARRRKRKTVKKGLNRKLLYSVVLVTIVLLAVLALYYMFFMPDAENWMAAIIDQLAIEGEKYINVEFNNTVTSMLNVSGFDVKYYPGKDVDIDFYKDLPSKGGKIIVLRAHSAVRSDNNNNFVDLFTSERYDPQKEEKYSNYRTQISIAEFLGTNTKYFAVGPTFVDWSMKGRFSSDCVIILMGCNGLNETSMAEALVRRGARVVIGWIGWVEVNDTDSSTKQLLQYLLDQNTIYDAVDKINKESHQNNVELDYYPKDEKTKYYKIPKRKNQALTSIIPESFCILPLIIAPKWKTGQGESVGERFAYSST